MEDKKISNIISNKILKNKKYFLIQNNNTKETNIINNLISDPKLSKYNFILLNTGQKEPNYKNFNSFFNFSKIEEFSKISFFINNKHILIEYKDFLNKKKEYKITPCVGSQEYKNIFQRKKYNILNNEFDFNFKKNILVVKNIEEISFSKLKFLNYNLKLIFNHKKFFGGIKVVFLGDFNYKLYKQTCIYDLVLYENKFIKKFNIFSFYNKTFLEKYKIFYENIYVDKTITFNFFFNAYQLDIDYQTDEKNLNKLFFKNCIFLSNSKNIIEEINEEQNIKLKKQINVLSDDEVNKTLFENLNSSLQNYYLTYFPDKLFIAKNLKILFLQNIDNLKIQKGTIGFVKKIIFKKKVNEKNVSVNNIKYIKVKIEDTDYNIKPQELILKEKNKIFFKRTQLPFIPAWCVHTRFIKYLNLENVVLVLSNNFSYHILEKCFKESKNLYFKNSFYLTDKMFFKSSSLLNHIEKIFYK